MKSDLCNRCGSCVGLSEGKIVFIDREGDFRPVVKQEPDEEMSARLLNACAGKVFNFPEYRKQFYPETPSFHTYTGPYNGIFIAHSTDETIRKTGASGGMISAILIWMLNRGWIDGAVVTGMSKEKPWLAQSFIATTPDEILEAAQSKYIITSVNEILPEIAAFKGKLAYVGLPGQIQSIRKLQFAGDSAVANIKYIFGPFYGNTLHFSSVRSFLKSYKIKDYTNISKLYFRYGEWPGNMRVEMTDGRAVELPKFHANYLIPFHILKNSLLCTDLSNEFTDISGGDAWAPVYEERGKGFSMVISRNDTGKEILLQMEKEGLIALTPISIDEAITMHSHGYDLKKRGTFIRIRFRKMLGLPVPDYGYTLSDFTFTRYFMEIMIDALFLTLGTAPARWLVEQFSPSFIGKLFEHSRKIWKKSTHKIKRQDLQ
ncbi:MAG: Coenzyme F420 hydrogenase/dehydrogenase, beta subunit C-terminal domain [Lentimicrobiaceae bacterium]|nr:Coenzyme F420 hydrogenase/dehydrogenase, beta subunit C-terminal domain [Lentimicrobiaceae bacterium]